jgi:hypothetical protein
VRQIETECVNIFQTCEGRTIGKDGEEANWLASGVVFDLKDFQGYTVASPTFVTMQLQVGEQTVAELVSSPRQLLK